VKDLLSLRRRTRDRRHAPLGSSPHRRGGSALLAIVSGTWFPISSHGFIHDIAQFLPSYWLVQANRVALGGHAWSLTGWLVVAGWSVVLTAAAARAFLRDTGRA
jgi:ABC-2 type transport system permease protein